ncbi:hypothetical protein DL766_005468 [Monosporascus sp. MC13-8B]|uniref:Uncharacterized protein n=1 Tax=Monosporascus cannonballus TaxID=155416 RepID=A0ABY0HJ13_9PEZI|nr:hypothetical protein DL762_001347 [Monosporascus cannonballus]RYP00394.1 hypothetical protein DL763_000860 [Monosporascus cannonballus]RYP29257.1 hypothetical protein DL766_005468 [Monosporascus sp. MC13-8B]
MGIGVTRVKEGDRILSFASSGYGDWQPWGTAMVVREATLDIDKVDDAVGEITQEHGRCKMQEFPPPVYQLVGDCFLTTTRWVSPMRGLHENRWVMDGGRNGYDTGYANWVRGLLDNRASDRFDYDVIIL